MVSLLILTFLRFKPQILLGISQKVDINIIQLVKDLVAFFSKMRNKQLKAVQATGFCATTSPRTLDAHRRMHVNGIHTRTVLVLCVYLFIFSCY